MRVGAGNDFPACLTASAIPALDVARAVAVAGAGGAARTGAGVNASLPTAFALAGTALMGVAIFSPIRRASREDAVESVDWPALVGVTDATCDARSRIDLIEALGALESVWAAKVLRAAYESEREPAVRSAIASALSSSQSLVT